MLLIILAFQYQQNWIVIGIIAVLILATRSVSTTIALVVCTLGIWFFSRGGNLDSFMPFILLGFIIVALVLGIGKSNSKPEYYMPDYGGMMGGM